MLLGPKAPSHSTHQSPITGKEKQRRKEEGREREREKEEKKKRGLGQVILNQEITKRSHNLKRQNLFSREGTGAGNGVNTYL